MEQHSQPLPVIPASETAAGHPAPAASTSAEATAGTAAAPADTTSDTAAAATPESGAAAADAPPGAFSLDQVKLVLRRVKDPELNLNIVDLGLVYDIAVQGTDVLVDMSLTSPGCPSGPEIMGEAETQLRTLPGVGDVKITLVWSPPWTPERIEPRVRTYLGF